MTKVGKSDWERTFAGTLGNDEDAPQAVALCEIIATAIVTRFSDYSETQPIAVNSAAHKKHPHPRPRR